MSQLPAYETLGIVDIELEGEDYHHMYIKRLDEKTLYLASSRLFDADKEFTVRFTLPIVDWVFEARGSVGDVPQPKDVPADQTHYLLFHISSMETADREQLAAFIELHKAGKAVVEEPS